MVTFELEASVPDRLQGEGLRIAFHVVDGNASPALLDGALRTLARLLVRISRQNGDGAANAARGRQFSRLTVVPEPSAHYDDDPV